MLDSPAVADSPAVIQRRAATWRRRFVVLSGLVVVFLGACSRDVTIEQVDRQVSLDPDGRVLETSASSTSFAEGDTPANSASSALPTSDQTITTLATKMATDGPAAIDCGSGATDVELTDGVATTKSSDGSPVQIAIVGTPRLSDFDGDGRPDLVATYRCVGEAGPVALSLSLWHASKPDLRRSAVSTEPIEADQSVTTARATDDGRIGVAVLTDGQQVRQVLAAIDGGRLRLVSDGPPTAPGGVGSPPLAEFPDRLALDASGLGPLRIGATEAQLTDALALVVSEVQHPPTPPCFGRVDRALRVGPIYFGLTDSGLQAIWVTEPNLVTTDRTIALSAVSDLASDGGEGATSVTVGDLLDPDAPPPGLAISGFGDGWVGFGPATGGRATLITTESKTAASGAQPVTGFGIAGRVCLTTDFMPITEQ